MHKSYVISGLTAFMLLSGCANDRLVENMPGVYRIDIEQGNILRQKDINKLRPGLSKQQVRFALGSPSIVDVFHQNRWEYIQSEHPGGEERTQKRLTLVFDENDTLTTIAGDLRPDPSASGNAASTERIVDVPVRPKKEKGFIENLKETLGIEPD